MMTCGRTGGRRMRACVREFEADRSRSAGVHRTLRTWWIFWVLMMGWIAGCRLPPRGEQLDMPVPLPYEKAAGKFYQRGVDNNGGSIVAQAGLSSQGTKSPEVIAAGGP